MSSRLSTIGLVVAKELLEVRRDSRSLFFMLALPIAAFPLVLAGAGAVAERGMDALRQEASIVVVGGVEAEAARALLDALAVGPDGAPPPVREADLPPIVRRAVDDLRAEAHDATGALGLLPRHLRTVALSASDSSSASDAATGSDVGRAVAASCLAERSCDAVLWLDDDLGALVDEGRALPVDVFYDSSRDRSTLAQQRLGRLLAELGDAIVRQRVASWDRSPDALRPLVATSTPVGRERSLLVDFMSYIMILMAFTGALYPAIDLTAGEKERGTLETLLVTPAERVDLVLGKFLVVALAGCVSAALSALGLVLSMHLGLLPAELGVSLRAQPGALAVSVLLLLPTACIFAALLLALSIFARGFKEAQSYATPLHLLIILPAAVAMVPGVELTPTLALVPVVNTALGIRQAWAASLDPGTVALMLVSSAAFAAAALAFCAHWFQREDVLFRS